MKTFRSIALIVIPLLFACAPKKPELPMIEVPAGPLLQALEQQRRSFSGLKAIASVEVTRGGRKRAFDTVGIVLDAQRRLRVEAFGPLGQSIVTLVWDGREFLLRLPEDEEIRRPGQAGIEKLLGIRLEGTELCAAISGVIPEIAGSSVVRASCAQDGACIVDVSRGDDLRRVRVLSAPAGPAQAIRVISQELYRSGALVYHAQYGWKKDERSAAMLPGTVVIENPSKNASLMIEYAEADVNVPVDEELFTLSGKGAGAK